MAAPAILYFLDPDGLRRHTPRFLARLSTKKQGVVDLMVYQTLIRDHAYRYASHLRGANLSKIRATPLNRADIPSTPYFPDFSSERGTVLRFILRRKNQGNITRILLTSDRGFADIAESHGILVEVIEPRKFPEIVGIYMAGAFGLWGLWWAWGHRQELIVDRPIYRLMFAVGAALFFFWLRCKARSFYGAAEIAFGIISLFNPIQNFVPDFSDVGKWIQIIASLYIIVRGLDNIDQGYKPDWLQDLWSKAFRKTGW